MSIRSILSSILIFVSCTIGAWSFPWSSSKQYCIVIAPAQDTRTPGRTIHDSFEHAVTMKWAEHLKVALESVMSKNTVIISRTPGQVISPLATAQLANRLNADLVISLHCYEETQTKPQLYLYHFSYGQEFRTARTDLYLCPLDGAYLVHAADTKRMIAEFHASLIDTKFQTICTVHGPYRAPLKPLLGITAPAFLLELGVTKQMPWTDMVLPMASAIQKMLTAGT